MRAIRQFKPGIMITALLAVGAALGCGDKVDPVQSADSVVAEAAVSYETHIKDIMTVCLACHSVAKQGAARRGAPAGIDFDTYEDVVKNAGPAAQVIASGRMPPGGGLPAEERALFQAFVENGLPENMAAELAGLTPDARIHPPDPCGNPPAFIDYAPPLTDLEKWAFLSDDLLDPDFVTAEPGAREFAANLRY